MTVWVSVAMIPIVASHFHRVGLYAIAANLALIPVTSLVVPSGLAASVLGSAIPWAADALFYPVHLLLLLLTHGAQWIAALPHATIRVLPPSPMMLIALYSAAAAWILLDRRKVLTRAGIGACAVVFGVSLTWNLLERSRAAKQGELEIFFLDVGDADATFVRLPDGRTLLVDAAGRFSESFDVGKAVVVPFLETQWIRRLDYALLTHPERDHAGGLLAVLGSMSVGQLWESGLRSTNPLRGRVLLAAAARAVPLHRLRRGAKISGRGYRIEVLHPSPERKTVGYRRDNDHSVVLRIVHGKVRILLASDLERRGERELLRSGENLRAEVLRVPHHGSRTSSSWPFLRRVRPRAAVISAGRPWRGHPSRKVISRYRRMGAKVFRTDLDGAVRMWSDGKTYRLESTRRPGRRFEAKGEGMAPTRVAAERRRTD